MSRIYKPLVILYCGMYTLFYSTPQTLFTVIFFASFHEFMREMKIKVPKWWAKHRRQAEGEVSLTELHDDEGIVSHSTLPLWRFGDTGLVSKSLIMLLMVVKIMQVTDMLTRLSRLILHVCNNVPHQWR